ncbi:hypothetical protein R1flu_004457 [Riccia fluitans]|uniref:Uncharacterized protein n=1 Tax=Riccia fluitans TaxID=41844 RepID=A0ABD1YQX8_9MARC
MIPIWNILKNALIEIEAAAGRFKTEHLSSWKHNRDIVLEWIALVTSHLSYPPLMLPSALSQNENKSPRQEISQDNATMEVGWENPLEITPSSNLRIFAAVAPAELLLTPTCSLGSSAPQSLLFTSPEVSRPMSTDVREESRRHNGRNAIHHANCPFVEGAEAPECQNPVQLHDAIVTSIEQLNLNQERNNWQNRQRSCHGGKLSEYLAPNHPWAGCMQALPGLSFTVREANQEVTSSQSRQNSFMEDRDSHTVSGEDWRASHRPP